MTSSPINKINVRNIISIFESQSLNVDNEPSRLRKARSLGNLSSASFKSPISPVKKLNKNLDLVQIEQEVRHLQKTLNNYKTYSKESHIYYQNQIFFLLADLVNIDTRNSAEVINEKSELMEEAKRLNKILNSRLPSEAKTEHAKNISKGGKKPQKVEKYEEELPKTEYHEEETKRETYITEEDAPAPSVKNLKKLFENHGDVPNINTSTKLTRKFMTFNGTSDTKYVPYSERFKSKETDDLNKEDIRDRNDFYEKSSKFTDEEDNEEYEKREEISADSLSGEESDESSSDASDDKNEKGEDSS